MGVARCERSGAGSSQREALEAMHTQFPDEPDNGLGAKAARFPGQELRWNHDKMQFDGNMRATRELVGRDYREGFGPPEA